MFCLLSMFHFGVVAYTKKLPVSIALAPWAATYHAVRHTSQRPDCCGRLSAYVHATEVTGVTKAQTALAATELWTAERQRWDRVQRGPTSGNKTSLPCATKSTLIGAKV